MRDQVYGQWRALKVGWAAATLYQRFEMAVALTLTLIISLVILVALYRLFVGVLTGLVFGALDPLDHSVFQAVFGEIMTLLIALEFNHTLQYVVNRAQSIIQTKIVLLIALLAVARKVIILDLKAMGVELTLGLAAIILVLGVTYWLVREQDVRLPGTDPAGMGERERVDGHGLPSAPPMHPPSTTVEKPGIT